MLSFTLSGKHKTYTETYALILNHNNHITITDLRIFRNSYNRFTYIIILVTNLCLFRFLVYGTEFILRATYTYSYLTLMADLFLFRFPVGHILILISRRTHTDSDSLNTVLNLYIYLDEGTYHVLIFLSILYLFKSPVGVTSISDIS